MRTKRQIEQVSIALRLARRARTRKVATLLAKLRKRLRPRSEHHPNCGAYGKGAQGKCDCYARVDQEAHAALDKLGLLALGES